MKYQVCIGVTVQAYGKIDVEADSLDDLKAKIEAIIEDGGAETVEVDWDSADDYRCTHVLDEADQFVEIA